MARKNKRYAKNKNQNGLNGIQWAGIGVIAIIIVAAVWFFVTSRQSAQNSGARTSAAVPTVKTLQWSSPPAMTIDTTKQYFATIQMAKGGEFVIQLYPDKAPITVNSFVFLAQQGFYNGVTFHRVLDGFMAQAGDPTGTGSGGPGYEFVYEPNDMKFDKAGVVAMANTGAATATNGSQFFITFGPTPSLDGGYTIFGQVISGMDVVNGITRRDPSTNPTFPGDAMASVTISTK
jgi:cyclophilin family peptidyl-prolyl cis-trans isomerase